MNDTGKSSTSLPAWADADLSRRLPELALAGERQDVETKEQFPAQARDLAKEIAAFATSNAGTILLGVSDSGDIVGLPECGTQVGRAGLVQRIEGLCANGIKPSITPTFRFGIVDGRILMAIDVPKGAAPLYYVGNVPYVRQITAARPAEPQEVIDCVLAWHRSRYAEGKPSPEAEYLSEVASLVNDVLVHAGELDQRQVDPWLHELRSALAILAMGARELAADAPGELSETTIPLEQLAMTLDKAAHEHLTSVDGWEEMKAAADDAMAQAQDIRQRWIDTSKIDESSIAGLRHTVRTTARKLASLASRLEEMDGQNRLDEIQAEAGQHGLVLLQAATFGMGLGDASRLAALADIARLLRDVEMREIYADGGQSAQRILDDVREASARLNEWTSGLQ